MVAMRSNFASQIDATREETRIQKEKYEQQLENTQEDLDNKKEGMEVLYQSNMAQDTI